MNFVFAILVHHPLDKTTQMHHYELNKPRPALTLATLLIELIQAARRRLTFFSCAVL
jgi:hypothetical protein